MSSVILGVVGGLWGIGGLSGVGGLKLQAVAVVDLLAHLRREDNIRHIYNYDVGVIVLPAWGG